jgi:hypothetical protein
VLVCGVACEREYLRAKGLYAAEAPKTKKRKARSVQKKGSKLQRVPRTSSGGSSAGPFGHDLLIGMGHSNTTSTSTSSGSSSSASKRCVGKVTGARARPASGFYAVYASGKRWQATIKYGGKRHNLGTFDNKEQTAHAYDQVTRIHKKEALLNFASADAGAEAAAQAEAKHAREAPAPGPRARPASGFYGVYANGKR